MLLRPVSRSIREGLGDIMKVLVAIDSFKGCLSSAQAGQAVLDAFPEGDEVDVVPVSDGGEGFSTILTEALGGVFRTVDCHDPLGRRIKAGYGLVNGGKTAVIETAAASGLGLLRKEELNPLAATSFGTGELMADALGQGVEGIWLGLGGSATCDGGTGLLRALGYCFPGSQYFPGSECFPDCECFPVSDRNASPLWNTHPHSFPPHIRPGEQESFALGAGVLPRLGVFPGRCRITGFYDVSVPFCGNGGAARMFAPQKGATPEMAETLDACLARICKAYSAYSGLEIIGCPGAGAAGGIGGALYGVLGASMVRGIDKVLELAGFGSRLRGCDLVITGEGKADAQTLRGKVPFGVLEYVRRHSCTQENPPVILLAGRVSGEESLRDAGFASVLQVTPDGTPLPEALDPVFARANITRAVRRFLT